MMVILKLPIAYLIGVVWWAVRAAPDPYGRRARPEPRGRPARALSVARDPPSALAAATVARRSVAALRR